jgi:hypothetical protein
LTTLKMAVHGTDPDREGQRGDDEKPRLLAQAADGFAQIGQ